MSSCSGILSPFAVAGITVAAVLLLEVILTLTFYLVVLASPRRAALRQRRGGRTPAKVDEAGSGEGGTVVKSAASGRASFFNKWLSNDAAAVYSPVRLSAEDAERRGVEVLPRPGGERSKRPQQTMPLALPPHPPVPPAPEVPAQYAFYAPALAGAIAAQPTIATALYDPLVLPIERPALAPLRIPTSSPSHTLVPSPSAPAIQPGPRPAANGSTTTPRTRSAWLKRLSDSFLAPAQAQAHAPRQAPARLTKTPAPFSNLAPHRFALTSRTVDAPDNVLEERVPLHALQGYIVHGRAVL